MGWLPWTCGALGYFGIVSEIFPVFSRRPVFGYKGLIFATLSIGALSMAVWAHHMFATGAVLLPFFSLMSFLIAVPTGVKFFNWIGTMWKEQLTFETSMLWSLGFLVTFLFGGLTGVILASPPLDFQGSDTYFVVAHFHYVLFGTIVFSTFAGIYFWFPKMTGRMLNERLGRYHFWLTFVGFQTTFLVQHWLGAEGMPRRYADYLPTDGFTTLNTISTIGASCSAPRRSRSCGTSSPATATANRSWWTTPGDTATHWSGQPRVHRPGTTSARCPEAVPSVPPSSCTTPIRSPVCEKRRTSCPPSAGTVWPHPPNAWPTAPNPTKSAERPKIPITDSHDSYFDLK